MRSPTNRELLSLVVWVTGTTALLGVLMFAFSQGDARRVAALSRAVESLRADVDALSREGPARRDRTALVDLAHAIADLDRDLAAAISKSRARLDADGSDADPAIDAVEDCRARCRADLAELAEIEAELRARAAALLVALRDSAP